MVSIHFDKDALEEYRRIEKENKKLFLVVDRKLNELKAGLEKDGRPTIGEIIQMKELSAKRRKFLLRCGFRALWKIDLPEGWRMVYSLTNEGIEIIAFVLVLGDHKEYERYLNS